MPVHRIWSEVTRKWILMYKIHSAQHRFSRPSNDLNFDLSLASGFELLLLLNYYYCWIAEISQQEGINSPQLLPTGLSPVNRMCICNATTNNRGKTQRRPTEEEEETAALTTHQTIPNFSTNTTALLSSHRRSCEANPHPAACLE